MFPIQFDVNLAFLVALAATILAVVFDWFLWLAKAFDPLEEAVKRLIVLLLLIVITVAIFIGGCYGVFKINVACTVAGALTCLGYLIEAVVTNFSIHKVTKPSDLAKLRMFGLKKGRR